MPATDLQSPWVVVISVNLLFVATSASFGVILFDDLMTGLLEGLAGGVAFTLAYLYYRPDDGEGQSRTRLP